MTLTEGFLKRSRKADALFLQGRKLSDVSALEKAEDPESYTVLHLDSNALTAVPGLARFANLVTLNLACNKIERLGFLAGLEKVKHLFLDNNNISDRQEFAHIRDKQYVDLTVFSNPFIGVGFDPQRFQEEFGLRVLCFNGVYAKKEDITIQKQYKAIKGQEQQ